MSKESLKKYVVTGRYANINAGLVTLNKDQFRRRRHAVEAVEAFDDKAGTGLFNVVQPIQFKNGERFEHDGVFPKSMAESVADPKETTVNKETRKTVKKKSVMD